MIKIIRHIRQGFSIFWNLNSVKELQLLIAVSFLLTITDVTGLLLLGQLINVALLNLPSSKVLLNYIPWLGDVYILILAIFFKVMLSYYFISLQNKIMLNFESRIRRGIYINIFLKNYKETLDRPFEEVLYKIQTRTKQYTESFLIPAIRLLVEISTLTLTFLLMMSVFYLQTLVIFLVTLLLGITYNFLLNPVLYKLACNYNNSEKRISKVINETKIGLREIIVFSTKRKFSERFFLHAKRSADDYTYMANITAFWKYLPEILIIFVTIVMVILNLDFANVGNYGGYGVAILMKMLVTSGFLISTTSNFKKSEEIFRNTPELFMSNDNITDELNNRKISQLVIDNIKIQHKNKNRIFTVGANLTLRPGVYLLNSKSGTGKSSLIDVIMGLKNPFSGDIWLTSKGENLKTNPDYFALSSQNPIIFSGTILDNIFFGGDFPFDTPLAKKYIERLNLKKSVMPEDFLNTKVDSINANFSGGQIQKISLIRTLMSKRNIVIFDEPTNGLDFKSKNRFLQCVRELNKDKIVIIISHDEIFTYDGFKVIDVVDGNFLIR